MNIGKMLDSSIQNLDWLQNPETYDVSKHYKKNDVIRELEFQWGDGNSQVRDFEIEEPIEVVTPKVEEDESLAVVRSAKNLIASGKSGLDVVGRLNKKYGSETVQGSVGALRSTFELDGVAGCFAVDCSGFASCRQALEHAQKSPYKRFLAFVVNHDEGKACHRIASERRASGGGSMDGLLSDDKMVVTKEAHCSEIGLPVLSYDGVSPEFTDKSVIDLLTLGKISEKDAKEVREMTASPFKKLREAFRRAMHNDYVAGRKSYTAKVDSKDHRVEACDFNVELAEKMIVQSPQEVDPVDHMGSSEVELGDNITFDSLDIDERGSMEDFDIQTAANSLVGVDPNGTSFGQPLDLDDSVGFVAQPVDRGDGQLSMFDLNDEAQYDPQQDVGGVKSVVEDIDIDMFSGVDVNPETNSLFDLDVNDEQDMSMLDVDESGAGQEVDVDDEFTDIDIDPTGVVDKEFEGTDVIDLDTVTHSRCPMDIDNSSDFSF
jgi:hypothetical protein